MLLALHITFSTCFSLSARKYSPKQVLGDAPLHDRMVRLTPPTHMQRVDGIMMAGLVQAKARAAETRTHR